MCAHSPPPFPGPYPPILPSTMPSPGALPLLGLLLLKSSLLILSGHQRPLKHWYCDAPAMAWFIPITPGSMAVRVSPLLWTRQQCLVGPVPCLHQGEEQVVIS